MLEMSTEERLSALEERVAKLEGILQFHGLDPDDDSYMEEPAPKNNNKEVVRYTLGCVLATALACLSYVALFPPS